MSGEPASAAPSSGDEYSDAARRLRDSLKWLITALGAVGAVLLAGLSLTGIGEATGWRLFWAIFGFSIALAGVVVSAVVCAVVLGRGIEVSLSDVADNAKVRGQFVNDPQVASVLGDTSLEDLPDLLGAAVAQQQAAYKAAVTNPTDEALMNAYALSDSEVVRYSTLSGYVVRRTAYRELKAKFKVAGWVLGLTCVVVGAGIAVFAWGANPPPSEADRQMPILVRTPADVELILSPAGRVRLEPELGPECVQQTIKGSAIADHGSESYRIAIAKSSTCRDAVVEIAAADGVVSLPVK